MFESPSLFLLYDASRPLFISAVDYVFLRLNIIAIVISKVFVQVHYDLLLFIKKFNQHENKITICRFVLIKYKT